jgi:hypothetical protein
VASETRVISIWYFLNGVQQKEKDRTKMIHLVRTLHDKNAEVTGDHVRMEICHILM